MNQARVARRYAKAVLDLAVDRKATEEVEKDMRELSRELTENKALREVLASPVVKGKEKKGVLTRHFEGIHEITEGLLNLLVDNKRIGFLEEVVLKFMTLHEEMKGRGVAYLTTAVPMNEAIEKKALAQLKKITDKKVSIENKVSTEILGGFILRVGDLQYDASIATQLKNLKRDFTNRK